MYSIVKVPHGYRVIRRSRDGIVYFSQYPVPKHTAEAQLAALEHHTHHGLYLSNEEDLMGEGLDIFRKIKNIFTNSYSPAAEDFIKRYGSWELVTFRIHREPVQAVLTKILDVISFGKFKDAYQKNYDELYHLFMNIQLRNPATGEIRYVQTEKTPNIVFTDVKGLASVKQSKSGDAAWPFLQSSSWAEGNFPTSPTARTGNMLIADAQRLLGSNFPTYNPYDNNCQTYIKALLNGQGITEFDAFIYQPLEGILTGVPKTIATTVTTLGHLANRLVGSQLKYPAV